MSDSGLFKLLTEIHVGTLSGSGSNPSTKKTVPSKSQENQVVTRTQNGHQKSMNNALKLLVATTCLDSSAFKTKNYFFDQRQPYS